MELLEPKTNPCSADTPALRPGDLLDAAPDAALDELTRLASQVCGTPMAFVSFLDEQRQWFRSRIGLDLAHAPREHSFCSQTVLQGGLFVVEDAAKDTRFTRHPLLAPPCQVRFYAGVPLFVQDGG